MKYRSVCAAVAVVLAGGAMATVSACEFGKKSSESYQTIGLSEAQITQLEALRNSVKAVRAETDTKSEEVRKQADLEVLKKAPDRKQITALSKQQGTLRTKVSEARADALLKAKKLISDEQFAKLVGMHWGCRCTESDSSTVPKE